MKIHQDLTLTCEHEGDAQSLASQAEEILGRGYIGWENVNVANWLLEAQATPGNRLMLATTVMPARFLQAATAWYRKQSNLHREGIKEATARVKNLEKTIDKHEVTVSRLRDKIRIRDESLNAVLDKAESLVAAGSDAFIEGD